MLQSQFTANAQHPDKYDGLDFEVRKAEHLPLDGSPLTLEEIRFLEANAFKFPQLAEKYKVHEVLTKQPGTEEQLTPHKQKVKRKLADIVDYIGDGSASLSELTANFTGSKSYILKHVKKLIADGVLIRENGPRGSHIYMKPDCDTSPH